MSSFHHTHADIAVDDIEYKFVEQFRGDPDDVFCDGVVVAIGTGRRKNIRSCNFDDGVKGKLRTLAQLTKLAENQFGEAPENESDDYWSSAGDESFNASGDDQSAGDESYNASEDDETLEESATANAMTAPSEALKSRFWSELIQMDLKELEARPTACDQ